MLIHPCAKDHIARYGEIYSTAFSGEPWNDPWTVENAIIHIQELFESKHCYGLEAVIGTKVVGLLLGTTTLFFSGRVFEMKDLAVDPEYQGRGIATQLLQQCFADMKSQGIVRVELLTAGKGVLPAFYENCGFIRDKKLILMQRKI